MVRVIKWRRMRWAGHAARMGEERRVYRVLVRKANVTYIVSYSAVVFAVYTR